MPYPIFAQRILENLSTAVLWFDHHLRLRAINPAGEALLALSAKQACGQPVEYLFMETDKLPRIMAKALAENLTIMEYGLSLSLSGGRRFTVDCTLTPVTELPESREVALELVHVDQHLWLSREESQFLQQQTAQHVIRSLAHEIKNPLGGIRGAAQLLAREVSTQTELQEYTDIIIHEADRLQALLDRLLGPRVLPKIEQFNIHEKLCQAARLVATDFGKKLEINHDFDPSIPEITGDKDQLYQAVLNVLRNAAQALGEQGGRILIRTRVRRRMTLGTRQHKLVLQIDICDNGPGIPDELRDKIFYPLITGRAEGTGLGLSIAQNCLFHHNGLITCNSRPGETIFTFWLPLK